MLFWRLPPPVRSLVLSNSRCNTWSHCVDSSKRAFSLSPIHLRSEVLHASDKAADPLKILFCGADDFSVESLRHLDYYRRSSSAIESLEVVHRPGKRAGRGLKEIREVPIKHVATKELGLPTHEIDTFTGWTPPTPYNLIVAVSFGLFVPPRILNAAKYGGLNVHPSLLPDLYGPAPIHHAILKQRKHTGVSVQTLHPKHFDRGTILAQTMAPGVNFPSWVTFDDVVRHLGVLGGSMLVDVLSENRFVPPLENVGWYEASAGPVEHAEKITKTHSYLDFTNMEASAVVAAHRALGDLWCNLPNGERVVINEVSNDDVDTVVPGRPGLFLDGPKAALLIRTAEGRALQVKRCTVAGGKKGGGYQHVKKVLEAASNA